MIQIKKILYASSLSDGSKAVYEYAIQMALQNNAEIIFVHAISPMSEMSKFYINQYIPQHLIQKVRQEGEQKIIDEMRERVNQFNQEELSRIAPGQQVSLRKIVAYGEHSRVILEIADKENVDMIVMGTAKNRDDISKSYTTREVLKKAKVPVFVVPIRT
ncbi:MAG: universal stress protein [Alcaligenaceae bacterium]|nr:universal stress protein [Alcaligenaceae bacterium]